ncbi:MAG: helix-turn-helix domain-containing protein [Flavobacteriales bacterium]|nr:helix-turn-helix domain-containing protein [Flavobacteriales bacterium]
MKVIIFEEEAYYKMLEELKQAIKEATSPRLKEWLSFEEAKDLLGFKSKSKLQQLRDHGEIEFSQHGRIIRYSRSSILTFLENHRVKF